MEDKREKKFQETSSLRQIIPGLFIGILLVTCGFFSGWYWEQASAREEVSVTLVQQEARIINSVEKNPGQALEQVGNETEITELELESQENCVYVGSKNSDKFHLRDSGTAKRIKEENKMCFESEEDAYAKGYSEGDIQ